MSSKRIPKRSLMGTRVAIRKKDGYFVPGTIEHLIEDSMISGQIYLVSGSDLPGNKFHCSEIYGNGFQQVTNETVFQPHQLVYATHNGREVVGHVKGRIPKLGKIRVSLDNENEDITIHCEEARLVESRRSPRLNAESKVSDTQTVPMKIPSKRERQLSDGYEPAFQRYRTSLWEDMAPSPKTPKSEPTTDSTDKDIIVAAQVLTVMSQSPASPHPGSLEKGSAFSFETTKSRKRSGSPCSFNSHAGSLGYHSQPSKSPSPVPIMSSSAPGDVLNTSRGEDPVDMFSYFGGDVDDRRERKRETSKLKYRCTYPNCRAVKESSQEIRQHVRVQHLNITSPVQESDFEDDEVADEDFYFDEFFEEMTEEMSNLRTSTPPSAPHQTSYAGSLAPHLVPTVRPVSPTLAQKFDHDYQRKVNEEQRLNAFQSHQLLRNVIQQQPMLTTPLGLTPPQPGALAWDPFTWAAQYPQGIPITAGAPHPHPGIFAAAMATPAPLSPQHSLTPPIERPVKPSMRRPRSDVKKCRKVYGINNKESWCINCRWKKACKRFPSNPVPIPESV